MISLVVVLVLTLSVSAAHGQLGSTDNASFTVQNLGTSTATVLITFYDEGGSSYTPSPLNAGQPNPFTLTAGASFEVYVPGIAGLVDGRYSVVISSDQPVVAIANLIGQAGATFYNGSYSGVSAGSTTVYLPGVVREYYNWNSLISVQNAGSAATNVTIQYSPGGYTHTATVQPGAAAHFDLETNPPAGMPSGFSGSAIVTASQPLAVTDNQTADGGFTQSYNGFSSGATTFYAPALYNGYYGWVASLNIQNVGGASTSVTVDYTDSVANEVYSLDAGGSVLIYMPSQPAHASLFAATITSSSQPIVAIVNAAHPTLNQAQTSSAFSGGSSTVGLPTVMKDYYDWDTSFTVQNVGSASTEVTVCYSGGYACYNLPSLAAGASDEIYQPAEAFLPSGYRGSVTLTSSGGVPIAAIVNEANPVQQAAGAGDWSMSYNGFNQ